jgi:hypothetical protein
MFASPSVQIITFEPTEPAEAIYIELNKAGPNAVPPNAIN